MVLGICGKSGSGKNTLINMLKNQNDNVCELLKATDRPPRKIEKNGWDYWFFTKNEFKKLNNFFITTQSFKVINEEIWNYGIFKSDLIKCLETDCICLITLTPYEVETLYKKLTKKQLDNMYIIYLNVTDDVRRKRLLKRGDDLAEINRRINADNKDFDNPIFLSMIDENIYGYETKDMCEKIQDNIDIGFFNEIKRG